MSADPLTQTFAALADPTRRAILLRLADGKATVSELVEPFGLAQPTISKHLKVLEKAGLITRERTAQFRPCVLNAAPLEDAAQFIERYRQFWEHSLDQLEVYVRELQRRETQQAPASRAPKKEKSHGKKPAKHVDKSK